MTFKRVTLLFCAAALAALAGMPVAAVAADLGYSIKDVPPPPPGRTWYLKGTIGMHNHEVGDIWNELYSSGKFDVLHKDMKTAPFAGIGLGVECNRWLRLDLTGEYRGKFIFVGSDYNRVDNYPNEFMADIESWLGLANAYVDLGTWRGVTPYIGAGIGLVSLSVQGMTDVNEKSNSIFRGRDNTELNLAWALYAGASYDVTPQFTIDWGYRFAYLGDAKSGKMTAYDNSSSYKAVEIRDVTSHDVMLNLRYRLEHPVAYMGPVK